MLIVISVIGIMSALIVAAVTHSAEDARLVIARQQQAVMQEALTAWITAHSSGANSLQDARTAYSAASNRLALVEDYLDPTTYANMTFTNGKVQTDALTKIGLGLQFSSWTTNTFPSVNMVQ